MKLLSESKYYDVLVIGSGVAGLSAAESLRKAGRSVAIIDERPFGGTCALRGCDAKKMLAGMAELADWNLRMHGKGVERLPALSWEQIMAYKKEYFAGYSEKLEESLSEEGFSLYRGKAVFAGENLIQVNEELLEGSHILIATGRIPRKLEMPGGEYLVDSEGFLDLDRLPESIVFLGGGFVSMEFAHIAARLGAEVHVVEMGARPLENFDSEIVDVLVKKSREVGITFHFHSRGTGIEKTEDAYLLTIEGEEGARVLTTQLVVNGAGRVPNIEGMELEKGNVAFSQKGILVGENLQSLSNPRVFAAGDVAASPGLPLTPVAAMEGIFAARNMVGEEPKIPNYRVTGTAVYTVPPLASVGLSEEECRKTGRDYLVRKEDVSSWYTYRRTNDSWGMVKMLTDPETGAVIGAQAIGHYADRLINHLALCIRYQLPGKDLKKILYAYPTAESDLPYLIPGK